MKKGYQIRMDKVLKAYTNTVPNPTVQGFALYWKALNQPTDVRSLR